MKASTVTGIATAAWLVLASCGGIITLGSNGGAPFDDAGAADRAADDGPSGGEAEPPPPDLTLKPTVWIGQTDMTVTYPGGFDGGDIVQDDMNVAVPERVVLILDVAGDSVAGTVTFGAGNPPAPAVDPSQTYPLEPTMLQEPSGQTYPIIPENWDTFPYPGFSYSLVSSRLVGNLLSLAFVPTELWRDWCVLQARDGLDAGPLLNFVCVCMAGACRAATTPMRQFDLTVNGSTMQGQISWSAGALGAPRTATPSVRLQRVN